MRYCSVIFIFLMSMLGGCSSSHIAHHFAEDNNWSGLAIHDVEAGLQPRSNDELKKLGLVGQVNLNAYLSTYHSMLESYCDPDKAFLYGIKGIAENKACVEDTRFGRLFEFNWEEGHKWQRRLYLFNYPGAF